MKNMILALSILPLITAAACAGAPAKTGGVFDRYAMDNNYFSCSVPAGWTLERDKDKDEEYKIYEI